MAGHSKWANIKHKKQASDARRGKVFTKLAKELTVAAKLGGSDEASNPRLKAAIIKAKAANMPKDNIERAVKKGAGELEGINYEEITYEAYAPGGIALIIECMTDKKSRTLPEVKNILTKAAGNLAENGAVSYLFEHKGLILVGGEDTNEDELLEMVLEAGGEDLEADENNVFAVKTAKEQFHAVLSALQPLVEARGWNVVESELRYIPQANIEVAADVGKAVLKLVENLENHDDVQTVSFNLELGDWAEES